MPLEDDWVVLLLVVVLASTSSSSSSSDELDLFLVLVSSSELETFCLAGVDDGGPVVGMGVKVVESSSELMDFECPIPWSE